MGNLWSIDGALLASTTFVDETASGWQQANFATPVPIIQLHALCGLLPHLPHVTTALIPTTSPALVRTIRHSTRRPPTSGPGGKCRLRLRREQRIPQPDLANASNYWVDVVLQPGPPPTLTSIAVTPGNPSISTGATQQFTATGTYSDLSTQNITTQVNWSSSNQPVATISNETKRARDGVSQPEVRRSQPRSLA